MKLHRRLPHPCPYCQRRFRSERDLLTHRIAKRHRDEDRNEVNGEGWSQLRAYDRSKKAVRRAEENQVAFAEARKRLKREGFAVEENLASLMLSLRGEKGLSYVFYPSAGKWLRTGESSNRYTGGGAEALLLDYRRRLAELAQIDALRIDLTLFTDASYCSKTRCAGWGAWMKGGTAPSVTAGGQIADLLSASVEAEMRAITNGLAVAKSRGLIRAGATVMVQSDCITALRWILAAYPKARDRAAMNGLAAGRPKRVTETAQASAGLTTFLDLARQLDLHVFTRHVKGHREGPGRQWVNRQCDEIAKAHMVQRRDRYRAETGSDTNATMETAHA